MDNMRPKDLETKEFLKRWYAEVAKGKSCCNVSETNSLKNVGYVKSQIKNVPETVANSFCGCGNPVLLADLRKGETVLDLGTGGGLDCFLAAEKVGREGKVIGIDLTEEMVKLAKKNATKLGVENVLFQLGDMEKLPVEDETVDVIISNCVINLALNKQQVFNEAYRVLKHGGRLVISDVVTEKRLPKRLEKSFEAYAACVGGALREKEYIQKIRQAGFRNIEILGKRKAQILRKKGDALSEIGDRVYHIDVKAIKD
ncbi:MAG: arsenite methyltransferase [Candidatus Bathyarchaeia archaeon]